MNEKTSLRTWRLTVLYGATLVLLIVAANRGWLQVSYLAGWPYADKVGHFVLMGVLAYLVGQSLGGRRWQVWGMALPAGSVCVALGVTVEEISQLWLVNRNFDLADLAADLAGIWFFGRLVEPPRAEEDAVSSEARLAAPTPAAATDS